MTVIPQCLTCLRRVFANTPAAPGAPMTCGAFPRGIPTPILQGDDHDTRPYPGDGGLRYLRDGKD